MFNGLPFGGGAYIAPSFGHELMLIVIGAVLGGLLGGLLGPLLQMLDARFGISPGMKQQKANYEVQREIAAHLATLVKVASQNGTEPSPSSSPQVSSSEPHA
jgi:hypothetical protein